jgi:bifunctional UDP-N-acetylglucosamine pyrophosphorylase/glucosamine-1-phosphate N-acetyltransferase
MILHVLDAMAEIDVTRVVVVVGHRAEWVTKTLVQHAPPSMQIEFVEQETQSGTGDALAVGLTGLPDDDDEEEDVVVLPGDTPLLRPQTLAALVRHHRAADAGATMLTAEVEDPRGYGRVVHGKDDVVCRVVEEIDATDEERAITEINTSIYCFRRSILAPALRRLSPANAQGEYYLTDAVGVLFSAGYRVESLVLRDAMEDPERTYVDAEVHLATDVSLLPGVILRGRCVVGEGSEIGPNANLVDTTVGQRATVSESTCDRATIGDGAQIGPFCVLRPGAEVPARAVVPPHTVVEGPEA